MDILKRTWAEIDLDAAKSNFNAIRSHIGDSKLCCVIKADAYGHGAVRLAKLYCELGADFFAVSNIDEALELRQNDINAPILILGYTPTSFAKTLSDNNITQAVFGLEYARALSRACVHAGVTVDIHIKIDTGMSRIGFMCQSFPEDLKSIDEIEEAVSLEGLCPKGIMAHFSVSDDGRSGEDYTLHQLEMFNFTLKCLEDRAIKFEVIHHANSGGIEYYKNSHFNMVRAGVILYGLEPNPDIRSPLRLNPVMSLKSTVFFVKSLRKGSTVSYGRTFTAPYDMKLATIPIGYADGYFRNLSQDGYMSIDGKKAKILGRICMDQTIVDVTDIENIEVGDEATIFSAVAENAPTADDLAHMSGTINYEIICAVSKRVPRIYLENGEATDVMYKI